jgi:hypothetical protein
MKLENAYYAAFDSIEKIDEENSILIFDSIEINKFEAIKDSKFWLNDEKIDSKIITIKLNEKYILELLSGRRQNKLDGKWFKIKTSKSKNETNATITIDDSEFPESQFIKITNIELIKKSDLIHKEINSFFNFNYTNRSAPKAISEHLEKINPKNENYNYNVYKVGQGSLTALTNLCNIPIFYFDLGGAFWLFPNSYPNTLKLCFCNTRTVILSHWDLDHLETARRLFHRNPLILKGITWIVPRQFLTPFYANIAKKMTQYGEVLFWSNYGEKTIDFWGGSLIKCNGIVKNDSGIALFLNKIKNHDSILNPSDSKFCYIQNFAKEKLTGLVASHHGGNFDFENTPNPISRGDIVYSHDNKYNHPTPNAVNSYEQNNWLSRHDTTNGSISFSFENSPVVCGCTSLNCDLKTEQHFI